MKPITFKKYRLFSRSRLLAAISIASIGLIFTSGLRTKAQSNTIGAVLYEHEKYGGERLTVGKGQQLPNFGWFNDKASSMIIGAGCSVVLYEQANYQGRSMPLNGRYDSETRLFTLGGFNDRVSSIKTYC